MYTPSRAPPISASLSTLPPDPSPCQAPKLGDDIPVWAPAGPPVDLDPDLDELGEFEHGWQSADGSWGIVAMPFPLKGTCGAEDEDVETRRRRKGKGREDGSARTYPGPPLGIQEICSTDYLSSSSNTDISPSPFHRGTYPAEVVWRRKAWWRSLIRSSSSFGAIFAILPRVRDSPLLPVLP